MEWRGTTKGTTERHKNLQNESSRGGGRHRVLQDHRRSRPRLGSPALMKAQGAKPLYVSKSCPEALKFKASWSISDFTVEELIATGESWSIHQGVWNAPAGKVPVTVKVHHREHLNPSTRQRIEAEITASTAIDHSPRILHLYAIFEGEGGIYMVLQHCRGCRPLQLAVGRQPDEKSVRAVAAGVLRSLVDIHRKDITHNNVKPDNVLIDDKGSVKLMNFEKAVCPPANSPRSHPLPSLRSKGSVVPASDISDLGAMVWELMLERIDEASPMRGPRTATRGPSRGVKRSGPLSCWRASQNLRHFVSVATCLSASMRPDAEALLRHKWLTGVEESLVSPRAPSSLPTFDRVLSRTASGNSCSRRLRLNPSKQGPMEQTDLTNLSLVAAEEDPGKPLSGWFDARPPSSLGLLAPDRVIRTPVLTPFRRPGASDMGMESSSVPILPLHQLGPQASSRSLLAVDSGILPPLSAPSYPQKRRNNLFFACHQSPVSAS